MIHIYERHISWLHAALLNSNESLSNHNNGFLSVWLMLFVKPSRCVLTVLCQNKLIQSSRKLSQGHSTLSLWGIQFCPVLITLYVASRCLSVVFFFIFFFAPLTKWFTWTSSWIPAQKQTQENTCQSVPPLQPTTVQWVMVRLQI